MLVEIKNGNKTYQYYSIQFYKTKHISQIHKGTRKSYTIIANYDITLNDINPTNSQINPITLQRITQYTNDKTNEISRIIKKYDETKHINFEEAKYLLKFKEIDKLYYTKYNTVIDSLYDDTITQPECINLLLEYLNIN